MDNKDLNELGYIIIGAALDIHKEVGSNLLESYYEGAMAYELSKRNISYQRQVLLPALYKGVEIRNAYRLDMVVENKIILEFKSVARLSGCELTQLYTYLRLSNYHLGYLINFSAKDFSPGKWGRNEFNPDKGIIRIVN
ncbi:MAG: GxxExxY protein [Muribaculaceae bacterium]|nr:GxxExxY protein [Muribaculaceae bacterium]